MFHFILKSKETKKKGIQHFLPTIFFVAKFFLGFRKKKYFLYRTKESFKCETNKIYFSLPYFCTTYLSVSFYFKGERDKEKRNSTLFNNYIFCCKKKLEDVMTQCQSALKSRSAQFYRQKMSRLDAFIIDI